MAKPRKSVENSVKIPSSEMKDEFIIVERIFSYNENNMTIGLANIRAMVVGWETVSRRKERRGGSA